MWFRRSGERGFAALDPKWSGGRPRSIGDQVRQRICLIARTSPADWGITAFSAWSLAKLRAHLLARGTVAAISRETRRGDPARRRASWRTTTTWKASVDPEFIATMHRILDLYDHPPGDGRVICVEEFGPLNLMPRKGKAWRTAGKPQRPRATYTRHDGVMHVLAAGGPGHRQDLLPYPHPEMSPRVPRTAHDAAGSLAGREAPRHLRQLLAPPACPREVLGCRQRRRAGVPADLRVLAELDRGRVRGAAPLPTGRHRPPQPRRADRRHRRLPPLAQRPSPCQGPAVEPLTRQPDSAVVACGSPTGFDSGEPRWRRYTANTAIEPTARNSDCQFCRVRFQKSGSTR
jgi:hypothetical protein